jgi:hypothetical protein
MPPPGDSSAESRQPPDPRAVLVTEMALQMQNLAQRSVLDEALERQHRGKETLVVAEPEHHARVAAGRDRSRRFRVPERQRLLTPHRLAGTRGRHHLIDIRMVPPNI